MEMNQAWHIIYDEGYKINYKLNVLKKLGRNSKSPFKISSHEVFLTVVDHEDHLSRCECHKKLCYKKENPL